MYVHKQRANYNNPSRIATNPIPPFKSRHNLPPIPHTLLQLRDPRAHSLQLTFGDIGAYLLIIRNAKNISTHLNLLAAVDGRDADGSLLGLELGLLGSGFARGGYDEVSQRWTAKCMILGRWHFWLLWVVSCENAWSMLYPLVRDLRFTLVLIP